MANTTPPTSGSVPETAASRARACASASAWRSRAVSRADSSAARVVANASRSAEASSDENISSDDVSSDDVSATRFSRLERSATAEARFCSASPRARSASAARRRARRRARAPRAPPPRQLSGARRAHRARVRLHAAHHARRLGRLRLGIARTALRLLGARRQPRSLRFCLLARALPRQRAPPLSPPPTPPPRAARVAAAPRRARRPSRRRAPPGARGFRVGALQHIPGIREHRLELLGPRGNASRLGTRRAAPPPPPRPPPSRTPPARRARRAPPPPPPPPPPRRARRSAATASSRSSARRASDATRARLGVRQRLLQAVQRSRRRVAPPLRLGGARRLRLRRVQRVVALEHQARAHELRLALRLRDGDVARENGILRQAC